MASTREIRRRIRSVANMSQITRAMEMVSAAKMRKAQQRVTASRPYSEQLRQIMSDLATQQPDPEQLAQFPRLQTRPVRNVELIVVTPDRGLTGALNTNILRRGTRFILQEAGARLSDLDGNEPVYNRPEPFHGELAAASGRLHPRVIEAMRAPARAAVSLR